MTPVCIGPVRIADARGTHDPGDIVEYPTSDLVRLAESKALDPESGLPYCELVSDATPAPVPVTPSKSTPVAEKP